MSFRGAEISGYQPAPQTSEELDAFFAEAETYQPPAAVMDWVRDLMQRMAEEQTQEEYYRMRDELQARCEADKNYRLARLLLADVRDVSGYRAEIHSLQTDLLHQAKYGKPFEKE